MNIKKSAIIYGVIAVLIALVPVIEFYHSNTVYSGADLQFHVNRIYELTKQIKSGNISLISYSSFNSVGSGVQYFYPSLTLIPAVFVFLIIKNSIMAYYMVLVVYGLIAFAISQYAFGAVLKDKWLTILGSILFSLSAYRVFSMIGVSAFGEFIAIGWLPLVFLGYYRIIQRQGWRTLWISVTLMGYTHLLSLVLTVIVLAVITVIRLILRYKLVIEEIPSYIKVTFAFTMSFLAFLVPFIVLSKQNNIISPDAVLHYQWAKSFAGYYVSSVRLSSTRTLGFVFVITLVGMFAIWKILSKQTRLYFWIGLVLTFIASSDFPWFLWEHTAISTLQFPYRVLPFGILFLTIASVLAIMDMSKNYGYQYTKYVLVVLLSIITVGSTLISIHEYKKDISNTYRIEKISKGHLNYTPFAAYRVTSNTFDKQYNNYFNTYGAFDYWTGKSLQNKSTIVGHKVLNVVGKPISSKTVHGEGNISYIVNNPKQQKLDLPFLKYNGMSYLVNIDGEKANVYTSKRGTLAVAVNSGQHQIMIQTKINRLFVISATISLLSMVTIILFPYWRRHQ